MFGVYALASLAIGGIGKTSAYLADAERSTGNVFTAGPLDFELDSAADFANPESCEGTPERTIKVYNHGNPFRYKIETEDVAGGLCGYVVLEANLDGGVPECIGSLDNFVCQTYTYPEPSGAAPQEWTFKTTFLSGAPNDGTCTFKFKYTGWQLNLNAGGFHDEEEIASTITKELCGPKTPMLVNKFYYNVECGKGTDANQWIEIYNPNDTVQNLKSWQLCNKDNCEMIAADAEISAKGYAVVSQSAGTWSYWSVPSNVLKITSLAGTMTMDSEADMLALVDPDGRVTDQANWGTPDESWVNYNSGLWSPGLTTVDKGHMLGRAVNGVDTDQPEDWRDFAPPTVLITSPDKPTSWICGRSYTVTWKAENPSGPDSDLKIDILYIKDTNQNGRIDSGDRYSTVATNLENSGTYTWKPACFTGYVWVKIVAKNPANFMLASKVVSVRIYEPDSEDVVPPDLPEGENDDFDIISDDATATSTDATSSMDAAGGAPEEGSATSTEPAGQTCSDCENGASLPEGPANETPGTAEEAGGGSTDDIDVLSETEAGAFSSTSTETMFDNGLSGGESGGFGDLPEPGNVGQPEPDTETSPPDNGPITENQSSVGEGDGNTDGGADPATGSIQQTEETENRDQGQTNNGQSAEDGGSDIGTGGDGAAVIQ